MKDKDKVISFKSECDVLSETIDKTQSKIEEVNNDFKETDNLYKEIREELEKIPGALFVEESSQSPELVDFNHRIDEIMFHDFKSQVNLSSLDITVGIISGIIASVIDIVFVGTPEVVKIYRGGENFDGSILTKALRKVGNNDNAFADLLKWLADKCKVPYDISVSSGTVTPNNHRLRNFAHDPLIGILFAATDIIMGTSTLIDNNGHLKIIINDKSYTDSQKLLTLVYYLGHLISDICTARGLPIPGSVLTQFFTDGSDSSVAKKVERMYTDGYDLRHLASMSTPVVVKNIIVDLYIDQIKEKKANIIETIAKKEIAANENEIFKYKIILVSDLVCCSGNALKFFIPPTRGNITALNLPEWISLLQDSLINIKYEFRDKNIERIIFNRETINDNWIKLIGNIGCNSKD